MLNPNSTVKECQFAATGKTYSVRYDTRFIFPDPKTGRYVGPGYIVSENLNCTLDFGPIEAGKHEEAPVNIVGISGS